MRPTVRQLEYLVAVAKSLNFREAARACHVSQPALSAQIARLEETLGVTLFERDKRRVLLTASGAAVVERARKLLGELDDLAEEAQAKSTPFGGVIRMGVIPTIAPFIMPRAQEVIGAACPGLHILWREEQTARLVALLVEGKLDVLLLALEADLGDLETSPAFRDPFLFAASKDHPLASRKSLNQQDLNGQRVLLLEDGHCLKDQAWAICQPQGAHEIVEFRATSLSTLMQMVSTGAGVTLLPALALPGGSDALGLATVPFGRPVPFRTIGLAWRKTSPRRPLFQKVAEALGALGTTAEEG